MGKTYTEVFAPSTFATGHVTVGGKLSVESFGGIEVHDGTYLQPND